MKAKSSTDWQGKWIWNHGDESPRNEWWCFRKTFSLSDSYRASEVMLHLTADSRYVVYLNGRKLGFGPVRSWTDQWSYDSYQIGHLLQKGDNVLSVLVMHWGISNFYYLRGRGGLLVQMEQLEGDHESKVILSSDETWRHERFYGQDPSADRMSVQQAFAEIIDARKISAEWLEASFDDSKWKGVRIIGNAGMEPWTSLLPREIPFLTEETVYPKRVTSVQTVRPVPLIMSVDAGSHFLPESRDDANDQLFSGYLTTYLHASRKGKATFGFPCGMENRSAFVSFNGHRLDPQTFYGELPEAFVDIELDEGDNLLVLDVSGSNRGPLQWTIGVQAEMDVQWISPWDGSTYKRESLHSPVVAIGPFEHLTYLDHQSSKPQLERNHPDDLKVRQARSWLDLQALTSMIPISTSLVTSVNVLAECIWKTKQIVDEGTVNTRQLVAPSIDPAEIQPSANGDVEIIVDFDEQRSGFLSFSVEAEAGTTLDFYGFEHLDEHGIQHTYQLNNTLRYVCREGYQTYESPVRRGMRFLMVTVRGNQSAMKFHELKWIQSHYPVEEVGRFACSDDKLMRIWNISKRTTKLCMEDTFVDCPAYEQTYWVGDSRNEALIQNYLFGDERIVERCLRLVPGSKEYTPLYMNQVPSGWNSVIPNWTFFWVIACEEYVFWTDNISFAKEMLPAICYTLDHYLQKINRQGLMDIEAWNLLDWAPIDQPNSGMVTHQNMFLVKALLKAAALAEMMNEQEIVVRYREQAKALQAAINQHLWSDKEEAYLDCIHADGRRSDSFSMQSQVVAILCGIAEGDRHDRLSSYLLEPPESFVQIGSPFMSFFYHEALAKQGQIQRMLDDTRKYWGLMLDHDATTCWEMFPGNEVNRARPEFLTRSHTHAWSAGPGYFLPAYVLGVRPAKSGCTEMLIAPEPCDLQWAKGSVPIPGGGRIDVSWHKTGVKHINLSVKAPSNIKIEVVLPEGYEGEVQLR
jgi:alpha-L-rhamnosidase